MSQIAQLSEAEIEARFHVAGLRPVAFMLAGFVRDGEQFAVRFGGESFLTRLLAALPDAGTLIVDCSGSAEINRRFLASPQNVFVGRPGGIHVQFTTGPASAVIHDGGAAFSLPLPSRLVRLQRREYFRIETPRGRPLQFFGRLPGGGLLNCPVHDISVAGLGLTAATLPDGVVVGQVLDNCRVALAEDGEPLFFTATIRHLTECEARAGFRQWRLGLQFVDLPPLAANRIQRYIARIEHERHGIA